jgi:hypothetical protein
MIKSLVLGFENDSEFDARLLTCIDDYLSFDLIASQIALEDVNLAITNILFGSKKIRLGCSPDNELFNYMKQKIQLWTEGNQPIEIVSLWGVLKGYGQIDDRQQVDIMDLMALRRFANLHNQVQEVYSPGLCVKLIREDVGEYALTGSELDLPNLIGTYSKGLDGLCDVLGSVSNIRFIDESTILESKEISPEMFLSQAKKNADKFLAYWLSSNQVHDVAKWSNLSEYAVLEQMGWQGIIPFEMRSHYLDRVATEHPDATEHERISFVCTYLGTAFARYQFNLIEGSYKDSHGERISPIKASFVPYPPGTFHSLKRGRVEYKVKDNKNSNNSTPPWAGFGFMKSLDGNNTYFQPKMIPLNEYRTIAVETTPLNIRISSEHGYKQTFRADLLPQV